MPSTFEAEFFESTSALFEASFFEAAEAGPQPAHANKNPLNIIRQVHSGESRGPEGPANKVERGP